MSTLDFPIHSVKVSVVIVNLNGAAFIKECLSALISQKHIFEIIIVDNGSIDDSLSVIKDVYPNARIIQNKENFGFAGPANQGASLASGEFILFLNNDLRMTRNCLETLVKAISESEYIAAVSPLMLKVDGSIDGAGSFFTKSGFLYHVTKNDLDLNRFGPERFALKGACLLIRNDVFSSLGGFDSSYFAYFEESDLCWRLINRGYLLHHINDAVAIHDGGRTSLKVLTSTKMDFLSFRNRITTIRKNASLGLKLRVLPQHTLYCLLVAGAFLLRGKSKNSKSIVRALLWHISSRSKSGITYDKSMNKSSTSLKNITVPFKITSAFQLAILYLRH